MICKACLVLVLPFISGCGLMSNSTSPDGAEDPSSRRFADLEDDERETVLITTSDESTGEFRMSPAVFDTVIVRSVPTTEDEPRVVEALLKGSFPDGCTELHQMVQSKTDRGESATLTMRRPLSAMCTQVVRPYRFFFELDARYPPGDYVLVVNNRLFAFTVE